MHVILKIFWNSEQARIRSGYRLFILVAAYTFAGKGFEYFLGIVTHPIEFTSDAPLWFFLILAIVILLTGLISVWFIGRFLDRRSFKDFGFEFDRQWWLDLSFGIVLGIILITLIFITELSFGWIKIEEVFYTSTPNQFFILPGLTFLFIFLCVAVSEELVSRGYLLKNLAEGLNIKLLRPKGAIIGGLIFSSMVFGIFHVDNNNATFFSTLNITIGGIFLGLGFVSTGRLAIPIGIHITWNLFMANVFGFTVSGFTIPSEVVTVFKINQIGPEIWTGGAFGPEGGLLCTLVILLGIILTFVWLRLRNQLIKGIIYNPLAQYIKPISKTKKS